VKGNVGFKPISEPWTEIELENGTRLKLRVIVTKVSDSGTVGPDGAPVYNLTWQGVMAPVEVAEKSIVSASAAEIGGLGRRVHRPVD